MKIAKWVAGIGGGLIVLLVSAVVILTLFIDPNRFRNRIEAAVQEATGRPFQLQGDLDIAWFPWLAVRTGQAELGNLPGVAGPPLARWQSARVGVRLLPLIHGELDIDRIRFEGLSAALRRSADGRANWDDLLASRGNERKTRAAPRIAGLEIRNGALDYVDEQAGTHVRISQWNLEVGAWGSREPVPVDVKLRLEKLPADGAPALSVDVALRSQVELSGPADRVTLHEWETEGVARGGSLPENGVPFAARLPAVTVIFEPLSITIPEWSLKLAEAQLAGALTASKPSGALRASGPLSVMIPSTRKFLVALGIDAPLPKDPAAMGPLSLKTSWAFANGSMALKPIALKLDETAFSGELLRSNAPEPLWTFDLHGDHIDLGRYLTTEDKNEEPFELPTKALKALRVQGTLRFDQARFAAGDMKNARLKLLTTDEKR